MTDRVRPHQEERWASEMDAVDGYLRFKKQQKVMGRDVRRKSCGSTTTSGQSSRSTSANSVPSALPQPAHHYRQPPVTTPSAPPLWQLPPSRISTRSNTSTSVLTWSTDDSKGDGGEGGGYEPRHKAGGGVRRPPMDGGGYSGSSSALVGEFSMSDSGGPLLVSDRRDVVVDEGLLQELQYGGNYHPSASGTTSKATKYPHDDGDVEDLDSFLTELSHYERQAKRNVPPPSSNQVRVSLTPSPVPQRAAIQPDSLSTVGVSVSRSRGQSTVLEGANSNSRHTSPRGGTPMVDIAPPPPSNPPPPPRHAPIHEEEQQQQYRPSTPPTTIIVPPPTPRRDEPSTSDKSVSPAAVHIEVPTAASMEAVHDACEQMLGALNEVHQQAVPRLRSVIEGSVGDVSLLRGRGHPQGLDGAITTPSSSTGGGDGGLAMGKEVWGFYTYVLNRRYADPITAAHHTRIRRDRLVQIKRELRTVKGDVDALATRRRDLLQNN